MTKTILAFPVRSAAPLACIWVRTGNPAQPLACKWVSLPGIDNNISVAEGNEPRACRFCA